MQRQCSICKKNFDESTMIESGIYYPISKEAEESREKGSNPFVFGLGILNLIESMDMPEESKRICRYDLEHNYEKRVERYICKKCVRPVK